MMALWIVLGLLAAWLLVLVIRAAMFTPRAAQAYPAAEEAIDEAGATARMQALIRCRTVSYHDRALEDAEAFAALPELLKTLYPRLHAACQQERVGERGLLYRWAGKQADGPSVFMAHYDVVPVEAGGWSRPPFDAVIEDGVLWGRGTLDTKGTLLGVLEAAEALIGEGFTPARDVYLAFGGDEEIGGGGAPGIVALLKERGIAPAFVLDEGGAVVENVFPGVRKPAALVGIGEKSSVNVSFRMRSRGGHASAPPPHTTVGLLARAVTRIEAKPFPFTLTAPSRALFDTLGRHSTFLYRLIFANLWCFAPVLNMLCKKTGGEMNALVRTTCAFTQMQGSDAPNVMPPEAMIGANLRVISGETVAGTKRRLESIVDNPDIEITVEQGEDPCPDSRMDGEAWARLGRAVGETWPEAILSPYLMVAASDARHFTRISECVYRFSAMALSGEERQMIHGNDERVPLEKLYTAVRFFKRVMRQS